jgi:hypothetical protein
VIARLSVIVTIVDAGDALVRCLSALATQNAAPDLEVIVPYDDTVVGVPALAPRFPSFRFLAMGSVETERPWTSAAGQHELFDRRRSAGLAVATGDVIAILEDRGVPRADWAQRLVAAHERLPHGVIGGAIANGHDQPLAWAVFFCDFNRYQPPFEAGPRGYVSDVKIGYKRRAILQTADLWRNRYHETTVHWALQRAGETLFLTPEFTVDQVRTGITMRSLLKERVAWGRLFAYTRAREATPAQRFVWTVAAPCLPLLLLARHARLQWAKRVTLGKFLRVWAVVFLLLVAWSAGEFVGYATRRP